MREALVAIIRNTSYMGKNEKTSRRVATLAAKVLSGEKKRLTQKEKRSLAASALTQTADRK